MARSRFRILSIMVRLEEIENLPFQEKKKKKKRIAARLFQKRKYSRSFSQHLWQKSSLGISLKVLDVPN